MTTKAMTLQLGVFQAINNIQRNIGSFLSTFTNTNNSLSSNDTTIATSGTYSFSPISGNALTVIYVSAPVTVTVNFVNGAGTFTQTLNSLLILDSQVLSITLNNNLAGAPVDAVIING